MDRLIEIWEKIKGTLLRIIERIEESETFEKFVLRYESLDPRQQTWILFVGKVFFLVIVGRLLLGPLYDGWSTRQELRNYENLISEMRIFNFERKRQTAAFKAPGGWDPFPNSNIGEFSIGLAGYLESLGVDTERTDIQNSGNSLSLRITELSIKQLTALSFQIDGFFPTAYFSNYHVKVNPKDKTLLEMDASIVFQSEFAGKLSSGGGNASALETFNKTLPPPSSAPQDTRLPPANQGNTQIEAPPREAPEPARPRLPRNDLGPESNSPRGGNQDGFDPRDNLQPDPLSAEDPFLNAEPGYDDPFDGSSPPLDTRGGDLDPEDLPPELVPPPLPGDLQEDL